MVKRIPNSDDGASAYRKRQKISHDAPAGEEVHSGDQLRGLLSFDQDLQRARHGLQSFKKLLDDALNPETDQRSKVSILRQYLDAVKPRESGEDAVFLADIMETWSFATQTNDDGVMSAVAVVLALVLQITSESLELVPHGLGICQTLLQERQLKSLSRNLSAEKGKAFILSPTLRLLKEAVCLDGGAYAKRIFRVRVSTFSSLGRNLEIGPAGDTPEDFRRASVRTNAVRFLLSCIKYLNADGKKELLSQKELMSHLTFMIKNDPPHLILEILDTLQTYVLMDSGIPRDAKFRGFNTKILMRFLSLYTYSNAHAEPQDVEMVCEKSHKFLINTCTNPAAGVLYPCHGLYPKDSEQTTFTSKNGNIDNNVWGERFRNGVPVYNFALSEFVSKLRPWSSLKHNELLVAMFKAAPELIADYFFNNRAFTFDPKLTMTWIGYAAFLFNTMTIPLPVAFGDSTLYASVPPPTPILLDNIIPQPINQKVLIRCLSPKSHLTSLFAIRILVLALEKLSIAIKMHQEGSHKKQPVWTEASRRLVDSFCQKIPDMKEVVRCYRAIPTENSIHRTMASRLLCLYYEVVPQIALAANFDVSPLFLGVLSNLHTTSAADDAAAYSAIELENLVSIASYSPGMRWFAKVDGLYEKTSCSTFTAMLRLLCRSDQDATPLTQLKGILADVAAESQIISESSRLIPLLQACKCTIDSSKAESLQSLWSYLDNCINRTATAPIKYLDLLTSSTDNSNNTPKTDGLSLLTMCLLEQMPFALNDATDSTKSCLTTFCLFYFNALYVRGEDKATLQAVYDKLVKILPPSKSKSKSSEKLGNDKIIKSLQKVAIFEDDEQKKPAEEKPSNIDSVGAEKLEEMLHVPFQADEEASVLGKWSAKSVEDLVEDDWAAKLMRLLASEHIHIRKEALTNILKMAAKINDSAYDEKKQVWLLLSELAESCKEPVALGSVPSAFIAFAIHSLDIIKNPLHPLYPKINTYLTRSPIWPLEKLPMAHDILHGEPSEDDKYYTELTWLLTYLLDGLKTPFDLSVFHNKRWFEKILALGSNPYLRANLRTRILRIIYRTTLIEGGSTTLVTRFGILSWLDGQRVAATSPEDAGLYKALMKQIWETCDKDRVSKWSKGGVGKLMENLTL